jgi:hypothetical protein
LNKECVASEVPREEVGQMAYAWWKLQSALNALSLAENKRDGLIRALNELADLRMKDLPTAARVNFSELIDQVRAYPWNRIAPDEVKKYVASLTDAGVVAAISQINAMRDAVAIYQPIASLTAVI